MPNYWDDLWGAAPDRSEPVSSSSGDYWDDLWAPVESEPEPYRGLPTDEWNSSFLQSEGWNSVADNPIGRPMTKAVLGGLSAGASIMSAGLDLFDSVTNSEKWHSGAIPETSMTLPLPELSEEEEIQRELDINKGKQSSASAAMSDVFADWSTGAAEAAQGLGYKYDKGSALEDMKDNFPSLNPATWSPMEAAVDVAGFGSDLVSDLAGMAMIGGPLTGVSTTGAGAAAVKEAGSKIGMGMALGVYGDTYSELTKNEDDSRLTAVAASAASALVQGSLEKIGWDVAVGKTAFGQWFKDSATASAKRMIGARLLLATPTETTEEVLQQITDIAAKHLPSVSTQGWDKVYENMATAAAEQLPEAAFGGALGGLLLGGGSAAIERLGTKDVAARNANTGNTPEDQIANSIDSPASDEKAKGALLNVIETVSGGDLTGVLDKNGDGVVDGPVGPADPVDTLYQAAKNANASMDAVDEAIKDVVQNEEKERAGLAEGLTTTDIEGAATRIQASIEKMGQERGQRANAVVAVAQNMLQMAAGQSATFDAEDTEQAGPQRTQMAVTPQEVAGAIQMQAAEMGLEVPQEALANPSAFNWQGWTQQEVEKGREEARNGFSEPLQAVREAIEVEADSTMASVLASVPEAPAQPVPMVVAEDSIPLTAEQSNSANILGVLREKAAKDGGKAYVPNTMGMLHSASGNSLESLRDSRWFVDGAGEAVAQHRLDAIERLTDTQLVVVKIKQAMGDVTDSQLNRYGLSPLIERYSALSRELLDNKDNPVKAKRISQNILGVVNAIEETLSDQRIPGITSMPHLVNQVPDIEGANRITKNLKYTNQKRSESGFTVGAKSMGRWLTEDVVPSIIAGGVSADPAKLKAATDAFVGQESSAFQIAPQIKNMIFNVWQTGSKDLVDRLGNALRTGQDAMPMELATEVADHLASQGYYVDLPSILQSNPAAMEKFSLGLIGVGKGIMSPWAMERLMVSTGSTEVVAKSAVAAMNAMSERWAMRNGKDVFEWWDRVGDYAKVQKFLSSNISGLASGDHMGDLRSAWGVKDALEYGKGILRLFSVGGKSISPATALHEMIHMVFTNNLMYEMLDEEGRAAMEELAGERLWSDTGRMLSGVSAKAHERMAMGFEVFAFENRAPNDRMRAAFNAIKQFMRKHIGDWMTSMGINMGDVPIYGTKKGGVYLELKDINLKAPQIRMFYQLLNSNPDGTEIVYNSPGIAVAMETLLTQSTGIPADGVFTSGADLASNTTLPLEKVEDDWDLHSGHAPSDSQWRRIVGLTNSESNGTHTHATLLAMEKEREYLAGLAKDVDLASESTPEPPSKKAKVKAQKELLKAVSDGEVLRGEALFDAQMGQLHKQISSGGKDAYGSGDVIDPTNMEQVKDMLSNFMSKMRSWGYLASQGKMDKALKDMLKSSKYAVAKTLVWAAKKYENSFGSESADFERELEKLADISKEERERLMATGGQAAVDNRIAEVASLNMGALAKVMNNHYALGKLADKVAEKIPALWDSKLNKWVQIAGARSYMQITTTFNQMADAYYAANKDKLPYVDGYEFHEAATRDLRMWMYSQRQFELIQNVADDTAKWEEAKRQWNLDVANALTEGREHDVPEPPKPKMPKITEEGTKWAESVKMLMELRYGKNLAMFKATAQELTQWENHMVLDKLRSVKMITDKEHADMLRKGKHHIPMYKIRDAIARSGAVNPRLDDSVYKPLDYLKNDISHKSEDPLNSMLRRAAGIEMLTMRQHAKNTIGQRILTDVKWWASDYADSPFQILSFKEEITKKEFDEIAKSGEFVVTSTVRHKKDDQGNRRESGHAYYKHVPFRAEHIEAGLKQITNKAAMRGFNKEANKEADAERAKFEQTIFAFYPEPGKPMYVVISDPSLAKAFFRMNNSQAAWQDSLAGKIMTGIDSMQGSNINAEASEKLAYKLVRGTATGLYGFNKFAKSAITSNLSFLYNAIFRDMTAVIRSRAGLRWRDIPTAVGDASALLFPSLMEIYPERFQAARDASEGMATFSGLAATNLRGDLDAEVLFSLTRGRGDLLQKAKHGSYTAISKLMWNDMKQFFAKEGLTTAPGQMVSELKRGKNKRKHIISIAKSPITMGIAAGQFVGTVMENTTRLAERRLMMAEDMSKYPTLAGHYNNDLAINGKLFAGFTGTMHRMRWERAKKMLAKDPNYKVPEDSLPVQTNMTERDYAMNHITLNFAQRGRHTATMDQHLMFFNPMAQDFYTNIMILARHSALQKAVANALGNDWKAAKDQVRLDAAAHAWLVKSFFYITIPAIAMIAMYGGDDDDSKEWQAQSMIEKLSYNWLPLHKLGFGDKPVRVAQGLGLYSLLFKDMPMAFYLDATEKDPKAWSKYWDRFFDSTPMGVAINPLREYEDGGFKGVALAAAGGLPTPLALEALDPMVELLADKEKYRNKAISFPQALAREDPTEVQRERHNMFVNAVTKAFSGSKLQPAQVKYLIGRYTPGSSKWIPTVINKAMEAVAGVEGVPEDVQPSNSPIAGQSPGWLPRWQAKEAWGMGNEFVQDLLSTARDASEKMRSYEQMPESRKPVYLAANPLINPDIYYGVKPADGFRSGGLEYAAKWVIQQDKEKKEALKRGDINETEAMLIERQYTMFAMEAMRNVVFQLGE